MSIPIIDRCCFLIFYEFRLGIVFWNNIRVGTYFYILDFCYFVMCLVCALPDVCILLLYGGWIVYYVGVWAGNIIVDASTIIVGKRFIRIPILVGDLFFFRWGEYGCCSVVELILLLVLYG